MKRLAMAVWWLLGGLVILLVLSKSVVAEVTHGTSAKDLGVSDYRHFVIYPHLEKALKAQKKDDEIIALREFEHIHQLAPNSIPLVLYLVEAYRYFDHDERARALLLEQIKLHPNDTRLQKQLMALPLLAGTEAEAPRQTEDKERPEDILQRAIYLQKWAVVDEIFQQRHTERTLSASEQKQWFNTLILGHLDNELLALQSQDVFNSTAEQIIYASALLERREQAQLERYLADRQPSFETAEQEKGWLYLLANSSVEPYKALASYSVQFTENLEFIAGQTIPIAMRGGDHVIAKRILSTLADDMYLDERYALSLVTHDDAETLRIARLLYKNDSSNTRLLNQLSWRLVESGYPKEAASLLMNSYPFSGNKETRQILMLRLSDLLASAPDLLPPEKKEVLLKPLPTAELRQLQSTLAWFDNNCQATKNLLGDFSPSYEADTWLLLAGCYRDEIPGLALYAYQQAKTREPNAYNHRAFAYQAYQVKDYQEALLAWQAVETKAMSHDDLRAATHTAQEAKDSQTRDLWLLEQEKRGLDNTEDYWWLHAQRYLPNQPESALVDFNRAITLKPTARAYASRATVYRQQGSLEAAVKDLRQALLLEPDNKVLQAALGYAFWDQGELALSREAHEDALKAMPDDEALLKQLTYVNQRLDDAPRTQHYARYVIDGLNYVAQVEPLTLEQNQELFNFRRVHEDIARRWTLNVDASIGLSADSVGSANPVIGAASNKNYRSFGQAELDYRLGRNKIIDGDLLSLYGRVYADTGKAGSIMPIKDPMLGVGVRWKPLRDSIFFIALEQQTPLGREGKSDTMVRVSASYLNSGKFSDEWHPNGKGWVAQNLYLDAASYLRNDIQSWTADYRLSWHHKMAQGQTLEPYAHIQSNGYRANSTTQGAQLIGMGARWNIWTGGSHYDAWPHKFSFGLEYQRTLNTINQPRGKRNNVFFTLGVHW